MLGNPLPGTALDLGRVIGLPALAPSWADQGAPGGGPAGMI
ncbi:MAG: hypothetical protein ACRDSO_00600 [Pseudonocardiaceae bacterium]